MAEGYASGQSPGFVASQLRVNSLERASLVSAKSRLTANQPDGWLFAYLLLFLGRQVKYCQN